ncbi:MAG: hypothetical protein OYL97_15315, partial [Candidatus Poribacteria bacterium]|nr:hypothetical protein [Candidatus Poribacteria bacterium]
NDALELENNSLKSEIQVMTTIQEMDETQSMPGGEYDAEYAIAAVVEKQIEALKTENDYLKKVKSPTQTENATLQQRNDALELENNSLKSEIQVIKERYETIRLSNESAQSERLEMTRQHDREKKGMLLTMACVFVVVVLFAAGVAYNSGSRKGLSDAFNYPHFKIGKVIDYLVTHKTSGESIQPGEVSVFTGVGYDDVLSILLALEKRGILTKSHDSPPMFYLKK